VRVSERAGVRVFEDRGETRHRPSTGGNLMSEKRKRATPDELAQMLALMRAIGATAPLSRLDGPGTLWVAAGGEGKSWRPNLCP
jgi:anthranilate phosphoribosyltransferase